MDRFALFEDVKGKVKAYRNFLKENKAFDVKEWKNIPIITKENYLLKYPLTETVREDDFDNCFLIGASSGFSKTGAVFWPKRAKDEAGYLKIVEKSLKDMYKIDKKKTLVIVSLAFGTWIGGMQLACAMRQLAAQSGFPLTTTLPGLDLEEGAHIAKQFKDKFEQVIWITNASNVTIIYSLLKDDKDLTNGKIFFPVVGEYFSESYREDMAIKFGHKKEKEFFLWTGYGSADTGDLAMETKPTITLRKYLHENPKLSKKIFGVDDTPMIMDTNKEAYIEIVDKNIVATKDQLVPLVRYNTQDFGGLLDKTSIKDNIPNELYEELPDKMLYVFGRVSDSIIFYGTNLKIPEVDNFLYSLDEKFKYSGLFEVERVQRNGVDTFLFTIYTTDGDKNLEKEYNLKLVEFFKTVSREFAAKYENLVKAAKTQLINVDIKSISQKGSAKKHRFIKKA